MIEKKVGIGEVKVDQGSVVLSAYGVGSCVVITLHDDENQIGGLAHCLLPFGDPQSLRYPKGAITEMIKQMRGLGAHQNKINAKIIGGATMFEGFEKHAIGKRNVTQTRKELDQLNIAITAEDVFGNWGRSIFFNVASGEIKVKSFKHGEKIL